MILRPHLPEWTGPEEAGTFLPTGLSPALQPLGSGQGLGPRDSYGADSLDLCLLTRIPPIRFSPWKACPSLSQRMLGMGSPAAGQRNLTVFPAGTACSFFSMRWGCVQYGAGGKEVGKLSAPLSQPTGLLFPGAKWAMGPGGPILTLLRVSVPVRGATVGLGVLSKVTGGGGVCTKDRGIGGPEGGASSLGVPDPPTGPSYHPQPR